MLRPLLLVLVVVDALLPLLLQLRLGINGAPVVNVWGRSDFEMESTACRFYSTIPRWHVLQCRAPVIPIRLRVTQKEATASLIKTSY
mmetsp:Transcript_1881/g.5197  ORF Transcript_1881/g.5197 Transcript_1881/m.5197 type:complete len:87 (+) Transcript_1881:949-1209(+)